MADHKLTVAGLGPGDVGLITRETWARIETAEHILLRTRIHPTVEALDAAGISYETYDAFYEDAEDFDELYEHIVDDLSPRARAAPPIPPPVPGRGLWGGGGRCSFCGSG